MLELAKTYDVCRSGQPTLTAVFIHGIASSSSSFDGLFDYLLVNKSAREMRIVAFDLLGAGKSYTSDDLSYTYEEQLEALDNSIKKLNVTGPLVLVGHSMGTLIATRYFNQHSDSLAGLVLVSAPIYRKEDIENPLFEKAMAGFREVVGRKNRKLLKSKAFNASLKNIVSDTSSYENFLKIMRPTYLIYGELDQIIASFNYPGLLKLNPNLKAIKTPGAHGVTVDKYSKILSSLKKYIKNGGPHETF